ncbi:unnamed protein product [Albugo candida]|uniref:Prolyl 4-hydroxylase alpha subunit domain-containing protein n=1 Tax=Albugo candida TaxID=65357 RepID=A0A024GCV1_9STRA|nr:unnamed protein product [Albugo candida]|eukprot:CCI44690.1 unnamed protein product [Albugo candida]
METIRFCVSIAISKFTRAMKARKNLRNQTLLKLKTLTSTVDGRKYLFHSILKLVLVFIVAFVFTHLSFSPRIPQKRSIRVEQKLHSTKNVTKNWIDSVYKLEDYNTPLIPLYESNVLSILPNLILSDNACHDMAYTPTILHDYAIHSVVKAMEETPAQENELFFMLNGHNEGIYVSYNEDFECIQKAANFAAKALGADVKLLPNGIRLFDQSGMPVVNAYDFSKTNRLLHILLDFQIWIWPGIRIGHKYRLETGTVLTTISMSPKVYDVENFFTAKESAEIVEVGMKTLERSRVVGGPDGHSVSKVRTSHTAFLSDSKLTRNFQCRGARLARLPSPSFSERLQLVRYKKGEFYQPHHDTFQSREFLPDNWEVFTHEDYTLWITWAADKVRELGTRVPEEFREGGRYFPNVNSTSGFSHALLGIFLTSGNASNYFVARGDQEWALWLDKRLNQNDDDMMVSVMGKSGRPSYLPDIIHVWEEAINMPETRYTLNKGNVNGVSYFYNWIRWAKERISYYGDDVPSHIRPGGDLYPSYSTFFESQLLAYVLEDYRENLIVRTTHKAMYDWIVKHKAERHATTAVLKLSRDFIELIIRSWEARARYKKLVYTLPTYVKHFNPQRFVTLFLYLNNETKVGGETVFPYSTERYSGEVIKRTGMSDCSRGLAVPPRPLHAALFYSQTPEGDLDVMSLHGGCPPEEGTKWGSNLFMWNADANDGSSVWYD